MIKLYPSSGGTQLSVEYKARGKSNNCCITLGKSLDFLPKSIFPAFKFKFKFILLLSEASGLSA